MATPRAYVVSALTCLWGASLASQGVMQSLEQSIEDMERPPKELEKEKIFGWGSTQKIESPEMLDAEGRDLAASNDQVYKEGRYIVSGGSISFEWSGFRASVLVKGADSVSAKLKLEGETFFSLDVVEVAAADSHAVWSTDAGVGSVVKSCSPGMFGGGCDLSLSTSPGYNLDPDKIYKVVLTKMGETSSMATSASSKVELSKFVLTGASVVTLDYPAPQTSIEFYGDSDTAAYGITTAFGNTLGGLGVKDQDIRHGWAQKVAQAKAAARSIQAESGAGVMSNASPLGGHHLMDIVNKKLPFHDRDGDATAVAAPDYVVILAGPNDFFSLAGRDQSLDHDITDSFVTMVKNIASTHSQTRRAAKTKFLFVVGGSGIGPRTYSELSEQISAARHICEDELGDENEFQVLQLTHDLLNHFDDQRMTVADHHWGVQAQGEVAAEVLAALGEFYVEGGEGAHLEKKGQVA